MTTLLQIHTSLNGAASLSSSLASEYVGKWQRANPRGRLLSRDFSTDPVPHLSAERFKAFTMPAENRSEAQRDAVAYSDDLIEELVAADEIVVGLPMYNFGIPSTLKAYFDQVARAGVTFRYTPDGPQGLLGGKRAVVFATRGGAYEGTPLDTQTDYVRNFLGFLGIADVEFVYAERTAMGEESLSSSIASARDHIHALQASAA